MPSDPRHTYYKTLMVAEIADEEIISTVYRKLAQRYHPGTVRLDLGHNRFEFLPGAVQALWVQSHGGPDLGGIALLHGENAPVGREARPCCNDSMDASLLALLAHGLKILVCLRIQMTVDINKGHLYFLR